METAGNIAVGKDAPSFTLPDQNGTAVTMEEWKGHWVVLYFYPRDNTPGCTTEAIDFTNHMEEFRKLDTLVFGISPDSTKSHKNFCEKKGLKVTLLSDPEREVLEQYGVWQIKKMYGKESMGVVRSTFLIDPAGKIAFIWPRVKVKGHAEEVIGTLKELREKW